MPTELLIQSYSINQIISNCICPYYYVTWNSKRLIWIYNPFSWKRMWPYFTIMFINFVSTVLFLFILIFKNIIFSEPQNIELSTKQLLMCAFLSLITFLTLVPEWLFITSGREWVYAINWVSKTDNANQNQDSLMNKETCHLSFGKVFKSLLSGNHNSILR